MRARSVAPCGRSVGAVAGRALATPCGLAPGVCGMRAAPWSPPGDAGRLRRACGASPAALNRFSRRAAARREKAARPLRSPWPPPRAPPARSARSVGGAPASATLRPRRPAVGARVLAVAGPVCARLRPPLRGWGGLAGSARPGRPSARAPTLRPGPLPATPGAARRVRSLRSTARGLGRACGRALWGRSAPALFCCAPAARFFFARREAPGSARGGRRYKKRMGATHPPNPLALRRQGGMPPCGGNMTVSVEGIAGVAATLQAPPHASR